MCWISGCSCVFCKMLWLFSVQTRDEWMQIKKSGAGGARHIWKTENPDLQTQRIGATCIIPVELWTDLDWYCRTTTFNTCVSTKHILAIRSLCNRCMSRRQLVCLFGHLLAICKISCNTFQFEWIVAETTNCCHYLWKKLEFCIGHHFCQWNVHDQIEKSLERTETSKLSLPGWLRIHWLWNSLCQTISKSKMVVTQIMLEFLWHFVEFELSERKWFVDD